MSVNQVLGFNGEPPSARRLTNTYQIQGVANQHVLIYLESDDFVPYIILINRETGDFSSQSLAENTLSGDAWLIATLPSSGTYDVYVTTHKPEGSGSYRLTVTEADAAALLLSDATNLYLQSAEQYDLENYEEALRLTEQSLNFYRSEAVRANFSELSLIQEARLLGNIGNAYDALGEYETSIQFQEQAIALKREIGNRSSEAFSLMNLGNSYFRLGNLEKSAEAYQEALSIWQELGFTDDQEVALERLGNTYFEWQKFELAIEYYEQSLELKQNENNLEQSIYILRNLGIAFYSLGLYEEAIDFHERALALSIEFGNQVEEASALGNLANVHDRLGERQKATELINQSLEITREIEDSKLQVTALNGLANIYLDLGEYQQAINLYQQAITAAREAQDLAGEGTTLNNLGYLYSVIGRTDEAIELHEQSLEIYREIDDASGEALALSNLFQVHRFPPKVEELLRQSIEIANSLNGRRVLARAWADVGRWHLDNPRIYIENGVSKIDFKYQEAFDAHQQSLLLYQELRMRQEEAVVLRIIGSIYARTNNYSSAFEYFEKSYEITRETGDPRGEAYTLLSWGSAYLTLASFVDNTEGDLEESVRAEAAELKVAAESMLLEALNILDSLREGDLNDADKIALDISKKQIMRHAR